ncbi:hypothetical protein NMY22_g4304 [Coprinellus aureogranulatus]|nr:hypothetical protein NMY22_g4304 [Coprinellus aureogranulatus]
MLRTIFAIQVNVPFSQPREETPLPRAGLYPYSPTRTIIIIIIATRRVAGIQSGREGSPSSTHLQNASLLHRLLFSAQLSIHGNKFTVPDYRHPSHPPLPSSVTYTAGFTKNVPKPFPLCCPQQSSNFHPSKLPGLFPPLIDPSSYDGE